MRVNYKMFIEENFDIIDKEGNIVPFIFNDTQNLAYSYLEQDYVDFQGIREHWLKHRQWGGSSLITGIFTADFILSETGDIPLTNSDVYSHKLEETVSHFNRASFFFDSWIKRISQTDKPQDIAKLRKQLLKVDESGEAMVGYKGATIETKTASAKVSGRGGTKQNLLFTEIAFYPTTPIINAKTLVTGATKQVKDGFGKIFSESTGNLSGDYFHLEYEEGKKEGATYKSRFFAWYLHKEYALAPIQGWVIPEYYKPLVEKFNVTKEQCYWHFKKTKDLTDKTELREFPTYEDEAFLMSGDLYFNKDAFVYYNALVRQPLKEAIYVQNL